MVREYHGNFGIARVLAKNGKKFLSKNEGNLSGGVRRTFFILLYFQIYAIINQ